MIIDYKMKLELGARIRENQREWYGKRGIPFTDATLLLRYGIGHLPSAS